RVGLAAEALALIQKICRVEKTAREAGLTAEQRHQLRQEKEWPIREELRSWLDRLRDQAPPLTLIGKAREWSRLIRVLDDGRLEVDNNLCENASDLAIVQGCSGLNPVKLGRLCCKRQRSLRHSYWRRQRASYYLRQVPGAGWSAVGLPTAAAVVRGGQRLA